MKKICFKLMAACLMLQLFVSGRGVGNTGITERYTNAEFIGKYITLSNANNRLDATGERGQIHDIIHLSMIGDIDKYKLLRSYANDEISGVSPFLRREVVAESELKSIVKNDPPPIVMHLSETDNGAMREQYADYLEVLLCRDLLADIAYSNAFNIVIYGENYFLTASRNEGIETVSIYADRSRTTNQPMNNKCDLPAQALLGPRFEVADQSELVNSVMTTYRSCFDSDETVTTEYLRDRGIIFLSFKKKASLS